MATYYVWSGATGAADGTSWTDAYTSVENAYAGSATDGDTILVHTGASNTHLESYTGTKYWPDGATVSSSTPTYIIGVDKDNSDTPTKSATVNAQSTSGLFITTFSGYMYGLYFKATGSNVAAYGPTNWGSSVYEQCTYESSTGAFTTAASDGLVLIDCDLIGTELQISHVDFTMIGGTVTASNNRLMESTGRGEFIGVDFSGSTSATDFQYSSRGAFKCIGCKFHSNLTDISSATYVYARNWIFASDDTTGNDIYRVETGDASFGIDYVDTATYRSGGATYDGTNEYSLKIATTANVVVTNPHYTDWQTIPSDSVGTAGSKTLTIKIANATADLYDDETWLEVQYFANSGDTLMGVASDKMNLISTSPSHALQTDDTTSTWSPSKTYMQDLAVSFTTGRVGLIRWRVACGKASTTMWVDPYGIIS